MPSPSASMIMFLFFVSQVLLLIFWLLVGIARYQPRCLVILACFTTTTISASFLGVHPSGCQKYTAKTRIPPLTFTHAWAMLPSFPGIDVTAPSSLPTTAPRLLSIATETPPDVCLRSSLLAASAANLYLCLASLLNCSSISSLLILGSIPKKMSKVPLYLLIYFVSVLQAEPFNKGAPHRFRSLLHLTSAFPFFLMEMSFYHSSAPNCFPSFYFHLEKLNFSFLCSEHFLKPH